MKFISTKKELHTFFNAVSSLLGMATMSHEKSMQHIRSRWEANELFDTNNSTLQGYGFSFSSLRSSFAHITSLMAMENVELDVLAMATEIKLCFRAPIMCAILYLRFTMWIVTRSLHVALDAHWMGAKVAQTYLTSSSSATFNGFLWRREIFHVEFSLHKSFRKILFL